MPDDKRKSLDALDQYEKIDLVLKCVAREDTLCHHRLTWALQVNIAIVAFIFLYNAQSDGSPETLNLEIGSLVGFVFTLFSGLAIREATQQLKYLKRFLNREITQVDWPTRDDFEKKSGMALPNGRQRSFPSAVTTPLAYCGVIMFVWAVVFLQAALPAIPSEPPAPPPERSQEEPSPPHPAR